MGREDLEGVKHRKKEGVVVLLKNGTLYSKMQELTKTERAVLDILIRDMAEDLNTITIAGDTRNGILNQVSVTNNSLSTIISNLKSKGFIEKTLLPNEYIVSPMLAYAGKRSNVMANYTLFENELRKKNGFEELRRLVLND